MKFFRFFIVCVFFLVSAVASADNNNSGTTNTQQTTSSKPKVKKPVVVIKEGGDNISNNTCGPRRAAVRPVMCPVEVGTYEDEPTLYFEAMGNVTELSYEISLDEDVLLEGEVELVDGLAEVDITALGEGEYNISLTVQGNTFVGMIIVEFDE